MDRDDFYRDALRPDFPNQMRYVLSVPAEARYPDRTFSMEAIDAMTEQFKAFVLTRIAGTWKQQKAAPHEMTVSLNIAFAATPQRDLEEGYGSWWVLVDKGNNPIDTQFRVTKKKERP